MTTYLKIYLYTMFQDFYSFSFVTGVGEEIAQFVRVWVGDPGDGGMNSGRCYNI